MARKGHIYRADWHSGIRCWCHDATDADLAARFGAVYEVTYAMTEPRAAITREVTAYSPGAARGAAEEYARKVKREYGTDLTVTEVTRL